MGSTATGVLASRPRHAVRINLSDSAVWALAGGLVLYLGLDGGGYGVVAHSQVGVLVWWIVLVGALFGLLPVARFGSRAWMGLGLFAAFVVWTALASTSSISSERSLSALSLVAGYLGVLVLAISLHRDRDRALRHTMGAVATAVVIVGALALASRLDPGLFPAAKQTSSFLPGSANRLAWPLNYWNALAALLALGVPLLLALATSARTLLAQALAAAAIPILVLCGYLTFSRGGALAAGIAVVAYIALAPERLPKLVTTIAAAGGGIALIAAASHRSAIEHGLANAAARHEGATLVLPIVLVCAGVALLQVGIGLAARHATPPRFLVVSPPRARLLLAGAVVVAVVAALLAGAPTKLSHAWRDFKHPTAAALNDVSVARFGTISSNGRYELWKVAVKATDGHELAGSGPGTYQLLWLPRAPVFRYVQNAHSLYFETLAEEGVVGLALLVAFFAVLIVSGVALVVRSRYEARTRAAGAVAALVAFTVSAAFEWVWQVPVLPAAFLLLGAALLVPERPMRGEGPSTSPARTVRVAGVLLAAACLVAIAIPLATTNALTASQTAGTRGNLALALRDARQAAGIEPGAASPQIQIALVEEARGAISAALRAARRATRDEPANWSSWLIVSRLEAEAGRPGLSLAAFRRARSLNPRSPLFARTHRALHAHRA